MKAMVPQLLDLPAILTPAIHLLMLLLLTGMVHQKMALDTQFLRWKQLLGMLRVNILLLLETQIQAAMLMMNMLLLLTVAMLHLQKLRLEMLTLNTELQKVLLLTVITLRLELKQLGQLMMSMVLQGSMKETKMDFPLKLWRVSQEMAQQHQRLHQPGLMGPNCVQEDL